MGRFDSLLKLFGRMTMYGLGLGAVAGCLVGATLAIAIFAESPSGNILETLFAGLMFGGLYGIIFGGLYGSISGLFSGTVMTFVSAIGFGIVRNPQNYKRIMGAITAVVTGFVFFGLGLWDLGMFMDVDMTWSVSLLLSIVIAVYASQIASRKYIADLSVHKEKAKSDL